MPKQQAGSNLGGRFRPRRRGIARAIGAYQRPEFDPDSFVPHNLQGEGPKGGAPVEIGITPPVGNRKVLINLAKNVPDYIRRFNQVFDFVPVEPVAKQAARERFKKLRQLGATITTQDINS